MPVTWEAHGLTWAWLIAQIGTGVGLTHRCEQSARPSANPPAIRSKKLPQMGQAEGKRRATRVSEWQPVVYRAGGFFFFLFFSLAEWGLGGPFKVAILY